MGIVNIAHVNVDRPLPLFPERSLRRFQWSDPDGSEGWRVQKAAEITLIFRASAFFLDEATGDGVIVETPVGGGAGAVPAGSKRLFSALGEALFSSAFPLELAVSRTRAAAARSSAAMRLGARRGAGTADFERMVKKAARAGAFDQAAAAPIMGDEDVVGGDDADGVPADDDAELEVEDDEDWNDYVRSRSAPKR